MSQMRKPSKEFLKNKNISVDKNDIDLLSFMRAKQKEMQTVIQSKKTEINHKTFKSVQEQSFKSSGRRNFINFGIKSLQIQKRKMMYFLG